MLCPHLWECGAKRVNKSPLPSIPPSQPDTPNDLKTKAVHIRINTRYEINIHKQIPGNNKFQYQFKALSRGQTNSAIYCMWVKTCSLLSSPSASEPLPNLPRRRHFLPSDQQTLQHSILPNKQNANQICCHIRRVLTPLLTTLTLELLYQGSIHVSIYI